MLDEGEVLALWKQSTVRFVLACIVEDCYENKKVCSIYQNNLLLTLVIIVVHSANVHHQDHCILYP